MGASSVLVVLPTLGDRLGFLEASLRSCQELADVLSVTIVMVVPRTADKARALGARYGAALVDDPGSGMADAVNAGISARTTEEFYVWVGDDDELVPAGIATLVSTLLEQPAAVVAYGYCDYVDSGGRLIGHNTAGRSAQFLLPWGPNLIPHPGTVIRLDALERVGGFDSSLGYALDLDVFLKLRRVGGFISRPFVSARFRWHADSATVLDRSASSREAMAVKNRHLPGWLRPLSWLWNYPVDWASHAAAWWVTRSAQQAGS